MKKAVLRCGMAFFVSNRAGLKYPELPGRIYLNEAMALASSS